MRVYTINGYNSKLLTKELNIAIHEMLCILEVLMKQTQKMDDKLFKSVHVVRHIKELGQYFDLIDEQFFLDPYNFIIVDSDDNPVVISKYCKLVIDRIKDFYYHNLTVKVKDNKKTKVDNKNDFELVEESNQTKKIDTTLINTELDNIYKMDQDLSLKDPALNEKISEKLITLTKLKEEHLKDLEKIDKEELDLEEIANECLKTKLENYEKHMEEERRSVFHSDKNTFFLIRKDLLDGKIKHIPTMNNFQTKYNVFLFMLDNDTLSPEENSGFTEEYVIYTELLKLRNSKIDLLPLSKEEEKRKNEILKNKSRLFSTFLVRDQANDNIIIG